MTAMQAMERPGSGQGKGGFPSSTSIEVDVESPANAAVTSQSIHLSPDVL